jgi:hydroxymethylpyrimidine/phosphomethylpyrimidine kinase
LTVALSIAGSDSSAGAGIQADLKTFSALGAYGCTAVTALTAQNTKKVTDIYEVPTSILQEQIRSVIRDLQPSAVKVGMVYSRQIIQAVSDLLKPLKKIPIVIDPIFAAGTGAKLLRDDAFNFFSSELIPLATIVTPNKMEAERLAKIKITSKADSIEAAKKIKLLGAKNVVVKGGHFGKKVVTDIMVGSSDDVIEFSNPRIEIEESHGSGCNFSAAVTAYLARGFSVQVACRVANEYVYDAIKNTTQVGRGLPVTNPIGAIYKDAMSYRVLFKLQASVDRLVELDGFYRLIPETQTNFAYALEGAVEGSEVAAVRGRIVRAGSKAVQVSRVEFGASKHMASALLSYMSINPTMRAVINIRYDEKTLSACRSMFKVSNYDRSKEPRKVKEMEGSTVYWGTRLALGKKPNAEVIYHEGDKGKEPMITIFGNSPEDIVNKIQEILEKL